MTHKDLYTILEVPSLAVLAKTVIGLDDGNYPLSLTRANTLEQIHPTISELNLSNDNVICVQRCVARYGYQLQAAQLYNCFSLLICFGSSLLTKAARHKRLNIYVLPHTCSFESIVQLCNTK